jgi:hypothetical protein
MNFLLFYLFVIVTVVAVLITILNVTITFKTRLKWVAIFSLPLILYAWDYPLVAYNIQRDCLNEGGIKIFISPEKVHRIKLAEKNYLGSRKSTAESLLMRFYPDLQEVFYFDDRGKNKGKHFSVKVKKSAESHREKGWELSVVEMSPPDNDIYILKREHVFDKKTHRSTDVFSLINNGKIYATITSLSQSWPKIRYPGGDTPVWTCRIFDKDLYFSNPYYELTKLII